MAEAARTEQVKRFWQAFRQATGVASDAYEVVSFDDSPATATELAALVLGGHVVLVDGAGQPACIWRTTDLRHGPLHSVDEAFARDEGEGEGDRSRAYWLRVHHKFLGREAERLGIVFHDGIATVFERFTVVWPPEATDPA
jgi:uncharacterized protein YhfF